VSAVWAVPVLAVIFGGAAMVALLRGTAESARELRAEVARFGELHVRLARLRTEVQGSGQAIRDIRDR
jgi:cytochrome c-type biogenesis protein CcmH/NrfF